MQYSQLIFLVIIVIAFYFLLIRPQQQRQKQQNQMISSLQPGTEIVTIGGIFGTVVAVLEDRLRIRVADGSELEVSKRAVGSVVPAEKTFDEEFPVALPKDDSSDGQDTPND